MTAVAATGSVVAAGRTRVTTRALARVVAAVTAEVLRVGADDVRVDLEDHDGQLGIVVHTPIGVPALSDLAADGPEETVLARCARAQHTLEDRVAALTGRRVARVGVHLTRAVVVHERRVA